jgi:hypothetical protein
MNTGGKYVRTWKQSWSISRSYPSKVSSEVGM